MNVTAPPGDIPIRHLQVLWFLYDEYVICCSSGSEGVSMKISVASMMTLVEGYSSLNTRGMKLCTRGFGSQRFISLNLMQRKLIHVIKIRDTVDVETPKCSARSLSNSPSLRRTSTKKNSQVVVNFGIFLLLASQCCLFSYSSSTPSSLPMDRDSCNRP